MTQLYSILKNKKSTTQKYTLAQIFDKRPNEWISKRELEKIYGLTCAFKDLDFPITINRKEELINMCALLSGDLQRDIRICFDDNKRFGLLKRGKGKTIEYCWEPKTLEETNDIENPAARNIFKTEKEKIMFKESKHYKCEICDIHSKDSRMAIDHWRPHQTYDIDDPRIAVLLCEKCNNIHHNYDGAVLAKKYMDNLTIVKRWVAIEERVCKAGFTPGPLDKKQQLEIIFLIKKKYENEEDINIGENFWKGIDN